MGIKIGSDDIPLRIAFLTLVGWAITILFIQGCVALWSRAYRPGSFYLASGAVLTIIFFRKRIVALVIVGLTFVMVNAGLTAIFHPSVAGIILTIGSFGGIYLIARWDAKRYPNLSRKDWKTLFENRSAL